MAEGEGNRDTQFIAETQKQYQAEFDADPKKYCQESPGLGLMETSGLVGDARNAFGIIAMIDASSTEAGRSMFLDLLKPVPTYADYINESKKFPIGLSEFLLAEAKPEFVEQFDKLAKEFNAERESIIENKNYGRIQHFAENFEKTINP